METTLDLDASNRVVLTRAMREAAGIPRLTKLKVTSTPGRIVLEVADASSGRIIKQGKLKVWTGSVPALPIAEAVEQARRHTR